MVAQAGMSILQAESHIGTRGIPPKNRIIISVPLSHLGGVHRPKRAPGAFEENHVVFGFGLDVAGIER
jgi:hypothetical protein